MAKHICKPKIDKNQHELVAPGTPMFPCEAYFANLDNTIVKEIPWHWHTEVELMIVCSGTVRIVMCDDSFTLQEGDGVFINANVIHSIQIHGAEGCILNSFVFDSSLISGVPESVFEQRYVLPLLNSCSVTSVPLRRNIIWQKQAVDCVQKAYEFCEKEKFGYEFLVREELSHVWYLLVQNMQATLEMQNQTQSQDSLRIKAMLNFLHQHYASSLELKQIAETVSISERECLRCFRSTIGMSPMQYLLKHRITVSAQLLTTTNMSITDIASRCGFDSPSYYAKTFKRLMDCTPSEFRKKLYQV